MRNYFARNITKKNKCAINKMKYKPIIRRIVFRSSRLDTLSTIKTTILLTLWVFRKCTRLFHDRTSHEWISCYWLMINSDSDFMNLLPYLKSTECNTTKNSFLHFDFLFFLIFASCHFFFAQNTTINENMYEWEDKQFKL